VRYQLLVNFYLVMAVLAVIAVGSMIIALSRLGPTIETLRSIGQRLLEYWRYRCPQPDRRKLNRALARSLTQFICAVFLTFGSSKVAIWVNERFYANPTGAQMLAEDVFYATNAPPKYLLDDRLAVPPNEMTCSNFGRYDLIHQIGPGRVDVIPRPMVQITPSSRETQRQKPLRDVACESAPAR
jgi:hypothetical protein